MAALFDKYRDDYKTAINAAIPFSGLEVDFFTQVKAQIFCQLVGQAFPALAPLRILDIGCGPASVHALIAPSIGELVGVDVSQALIERARLENPTRSYRVYDGKDLPFSDNTFDICFTICVMHHVSPLLWEKFVSEMFRVTVPGGMVIVFEHNPYNPLTRIVVNRCEFDKEAVLLRSRNVITLLRGAGFVDLLERFFLVSPFRGRVFTMLDQCLCRLPLGAQYYVAARCPGEE